MHHRKQNKKVKEERMPQFIGGPMILHTGRSNYTKSESVDLWSSVSKKVLQTVWSYRDWFHFNTHA